MIIIKKKLGLLVLLIFTVFFIANNLIYNHQHSFKVRHDSMPKDFLKDLDNKMEDLDNKLENMFKLKGR